MLRIIFWVSVLVLSNKALACNPSDLLNAVKLDDLAKAKAYKADGCPLAPADSRQVSALELAILLQRNELFAWLAEDGALVKAFGAEALVAACGTNMQNKSAIELLLSKGVDINALSSHHYNCLYRAAELPDIAFFEYLLGLGANPESKIVPAPEYQLERSISVQDFVLQRLADYQALQKLMAPASAAMPPAAD